MKGIVFSLLFFIFRLPAFTQASANALATATIVDPAAIAGIPQDNDFSSFSAYHLSKKGGVKNVVNNRNLLAMAKFKIAGIKNHRFSVLLAAESIRVENAQSRNGFWITELELTSTQEAKQFLLQGKPLLSKPLATGHYNNITPVEITLYFD